MASADRNKEEKKRVGPLTSIWELTVSERRNAATIIENTTAKPFIYCRYYFKCFFCKQHYTDLTLLLQHTSTHQQIAKLAKGTRTIKVDITDLKCRICQQSFTNIDETRDHLTKAHDKIFTKSGNGIMEYTLAPTNNQFRCHLCQKLFQTFILLNRHMNVHFNNAVCEICGSTFMSYQRLIQHKAIHTGGHPCSVCKKVYTTSANLKFHIERKHEQKQNTRMLRCSLCSERFTEHFRKLKHLKECHGVTFTFECEVCKSVFDSRRALTTHTNKQHSEKTKCDLCKKAFSCVTTLKLHLLSHTGERNYACSVCNKAYRHKKNMSQHMKSHFGDNGSPKWFACPECVIGFACKSEFNAHMKQWHHKTNNTFFDG